MVDLLALFFAELLAQRMDNFLQFILVDRLQEIFPHAVCNRGLGKFKF